MKNKIRQNKTTKIVLPKFQKTIYINRNNYHFWRWNGWIKEHFMNQVAAVAHRFFIACRQPHCNTQPF